MFGSYGSFFFIYQFVTPFKNEKIDNGNKSETNYKYFYTRCIIFKIL